MIREDERNGTSGHHQLSARPEQGLSSPPLRAVDQLRAPASGTVCDRRFRRREDAAGAAHRRPAGVANDVRRGAMKRVITPELLDEHDAPRDEMERSLRDLRRFNRWAGGTRTYLRLLRRFAPNAKIVVDLGAGTADLLDALPSDVTTIGVDLNIKHLLYERHLSRAMRVVADANLLPFRDASVDVVTSSHF